MAPRAREHRAPPARWAYQPFPGEPPATAYYVTPRGERVKALPDGVECHRTYGWEAFRDNFVGPTLHNGPEYRAWSEARPVGLGELFHRYTESGLHAWYYRDPAGHWYHVHHYSAEPPPLPRAAPEKARCYDGPHRCGHCGTDHWIELHGVADGYCTYCYAAG